MLREGAQDVEEQELVVRVQEQRAGPVEAPHGVGPPRREVREDEVEGA